MYKKYFVFFCFFWVTFWSFLEQRGERSTKHVLTLINKNVMKTLKSTSTIETFATDAMTQNEMLFIIGGGEPVDMTIPPDGWVKK